jgi:hypothetical protein
MQFYSTIQRSSVVERSAVNGKRRILNVFPHALYIGKFQNAFDPIYHCQYQNQYQTARFRQCAKRVVRSGKFRLAKPMQRLKMPGYSI